MRSEFAGVDAAGRSFEVDQAWFMRIRDGKAEEVWEIIDSAALFQQLGVSKAPGS
jgi:ketosteroid isomerase-like protein